MSSVHDSEPPSCADPPRLSRVVLGTDFSPGARRATRRVGVLPLAPGAEVVIVHAVGAGDQGQAKAEREARTLRSGLAHRSRSDVRVRCALTSGDPSTAIVSFAHAFSAELVVLGRHGTSNLRQLLLGSTAERVVHTGDTHVLVVGPAPLGPYGSPLVALTELPTALAVLDAALRVAPGPHHDGRVVPTLRLVVNRRGCVRNAAFRDGTRHVRASRTA